MYHHLCPRCGMAFPEWQPVHLFCFFHRLRYILGPFFIISALMSTGVWLHSRFTVQVDTYTEETQVNSTESNIPPVVARQDDYPLLRDTSADTKIPTTQPIPITEPVPITEPIPITQPTPSLKDDEQVSVYYVNTIDLNVRSGPGPDYSVITKLSQGSPVHYLDRAESKDGGFWIRIRTGSLEGWVNEKLLIRKKYEANISSPTQTPKSDEILYYVNTINLNVRSGPGPDYSVITKLSQGSPVHYLDRAESKDGGFWIRIRTGSLEGWVNEKLLIRKKYEANINDQNLASTSTVTDPKIIKHPNGIPNSFIKYFDEYAIKSDKKSIALALDSNKRWAAGYAQGFSTQLQANEHALSECMQRISQYNVQASCKLYAIGTNIIW